MGRIRTIKPEFFLHEELYDLEQETGFPIRVAFQGLWCQADREGRFRWRPRALKAQILPYDEVDFSRVLDALATRGFLVKYACSGEIFAHIPGFKKHQVINNKESASKLPAPDASESEAMTCTREARDDHALTTRAIRKGREGNKINTPIAPKGANAQNAHFSEFWKAYPRRVGKDRAAKAWSKAVKRIGGDKSEAIARILEAATAFAQSPVGKGEFCPHPSSWLNAGQYDDDREQWQRGDSTSPGEPIKVRALTREEMMADD